MIQRHACFGAFVVVMSVLVAGVAFSIDLVETESAFEALRTYRYGDDRAVLQRVTDLVNQSYGKAEDERLLEGRFVSLLVSDATDDAKAFACEKLGRMGMVLCVPTLASLLENPTLSFMARSALERIQAPEASQALCEALERSQGAQRVAIINSIGNRRDANAIPLLVKCLQEDDATVVETAAAALGEIGGARAFQVLTEAESRTVPKDVFERALLRCAERLMEDGIRRKGTGWFAVLYRNAVSPEVRAAAFTELVNARPGEAARLVAEAIAHGEPRLRQAALVLLASGVGGKKLTRSAAEALPGLEPQEQILMLRAFAQRGDRAAHGAVIQAAREGQGEVRAAALEALSVLGDAADVSLLLERAARAEAQEKEAALSALSRTCDGNVNEGILGAIPAASPETQVELIGVLVGRNASQCCNGLLDLAETSPHESVWAAAARAFGMLGDPGELPVLSRLFLGTESEVVAEGALQGLWEVVRRGPDPIAESRKLVSSAEGREGNRVGALKELEQRASKELTPGFQRTEPITIRHPNLPQGYELAAYVDCGRQDASQNGPGPRIRQLAGEPWTFQRAIGPLGTVSFDENQVEFEVEGLEQGIEYILGFTWWDVDGGDRWESVRFGTGEPTEWTTVLPSTPAVAYHNGEPTWARVLLPVPPSFCKEGRLRVAFVKEKGPNAVVNEIWLLRRAGTEARKRVLIVTGDDYPGHHWRETAPALAALLREDPRLEVSITEAPGILASPLLSGYDAAVIHFKNYAERLPLGPDARAALEQFVAAGKGLTITHFGCGAFQEWDGFVKVAGRIWNPGLRGHDPFGEFEVRVTDQSHPITKGLDSFRVKDELYTCLDGDTPIQVLCEATSKVDNVDYPIAFVTRLDRGRVFHCTLGHDADAYGFEGVRQLYRRAVAWSAGLEPMPP